MPAGQRLTGLRILVAEDVEINRYIVEDLLASEGATAIPVCNDKEAVEQVERNPGAFDAVLMAVQMPVMDGHQATGLIHAIAPALPIIGLTAHALAKERDG